MNAVIYCRVSTTEQASGTSLDIQEAQCRLYCERNGLSPVETFFDRGESAKTSDRPAFLQMVQFCSANKIDACVVHKLDRFSRNAYDFAVFQALLAKVGTAVRSATEPLTDSPAGKLMQTILAGVAQFDNDVRAERSRAGMAEIAARGGWTHKAPFGMLSARKDGIPILLPDPDSASHLVEMFRLLADGKLAPSACQRWLSTRLGCHVWPQTIAKIFKQRAYMGEICNRLTKGVPVRAAFDPLIDPDTWHRAQSRISHADTGQIQSVKHNFVLHGVATCSCGRKLTGSLSRSKSGRRYGYYHCRGCGSRLRVDLVHKTLACFLADTSAAITPMLKMFRLVVADEFGIQQAEAIASQGKLKATITKLDQQGERLLSMVVSGRITAEVFDKKRRELDIQTALAKTALQDACIDEQDVDAVLATADFILSSLYDVLCRTPAEIKPALTKAVFGGPLTLDPDGTLSNSHNSGVCSALRLYLSQKATMAPPRGAMSNTSADIVRVLVEIVSYAQAA